MRKKNNIFFWTFFYLVGIANFSLYSLELNKLTVPIDRKSYNHCQGRKQKIAKKREKNIRTLSIHSNMLR